MKIKVVMPDKAMDRETLDKREIMLKAAVSDGTEISVDCIKKGPDERRAFVRDRRKGGYAAAPMAARLPSAQTTQMMPNTSAAKDTKSVSSVMIRATWPRLMPSTW